MQKAAGFGLLAFAFASLSFSQSITVTPAEPSVIVGQTVQYSAQVTGLSGKGVTWSAGGVKGGNSTVGTINAKGLYRAPATPPGQNPVQIIATNTVNTAISGSAYAYIIKHGPNITAVAPNPLPAGTYTVSITGAGFRKGAEAFNSGVQLVTTFVSSTSLSATGYQAPATSTTFCVKNPGTSCGNTLTVPVTGGGGSGSYTLNVVNGSGGGTYNAGAVVTIAANSPPAGSIRPTSWQRCLPRCALPQEHSWWPRPLGSTAIAGMKC